MHPAYVGRFDRRNRFAGDTPIKVPTSASPSTLAARSPLPGLRPPAWIAGHIATLNHITHYDDNNRACELSTNPYRSSSRKNSATFFVVADEYSRNGFTYGLKPDWHWLGRRANGFTRRRRANGFTRTMAGVRAPHHPLPRREPSGLGDNLFLCWLRPERVEAAFFVRASVRVGTEIVSQGLDE
jgi:hypothetical protein